MQRASNVGFDDLERLQAFEVELNAPHFGRRDAVNIADLAERAQFATMVGVSKVFIYVSRACQDAGASPIATVEVS